MSANSCCFKLLWKITQGAKLLHVGHNGPAEEISMDADIMGWHFYTDKKKCMDSIGSHTQGTTYIGPCILAVVVQLTYGVTTAQMEKLLAVVSAIWLVLLSHLPKFSLSLQTPTMGSLWINTCKIFWQRSYPEFHMTISMDKSVECECWSVTACSFCSISTMIWVNSNVLEWIKILSPSYMTALSQDAEILTKQ